MQMKASSTLGARRKVEIYISRMGQIVHNGNIYKRGVVQMENTLDKEKNNCQEGN